VVDDYDRQVGIATVILTGKDPLIHRRTRSPFGGHFISTYDPGLSEVNGYVTRKPSSIRCRRLNTVPIS
jgi:hypothetical protein